MDAELIRRSLDKAGIKCAITLAETRADFEEALNLGGFDLILADYSLPLFDGLSALSVAEEICPEVPFIIVSGTLGEDRAVEVFRSGAVDYVLKDNLKRLAPCIKRALEEAREHSERKQAEEALYDSESRYKQLLESVTNYNYTVLIKNGEPAETIHNPACVTVTGYCIEEYRNDPFLWFKMIHDNDRSTVVEQINRILKGEITTPLEHRIFHKDGSIRWVRDTLVPKFNEHQELVAYDGLVVDITDRKTADEDIKRNNLALEEKIRERTKELENANFELQKLNIELDLRRAEAEYSKLQAETANRAKSDFLANMSHELRTPLNSILGFAEVLADELFGKLNERQKEYAKDISDSGCHLLNLINDILDLSKVESGKMELEPTCFLLKHILGASMSMFKEKAMKHNLKLNLSVEPDADIEIEADERKLKQIMFNLLSNALKFTPEGRSVHVQARLISDVGALRRVALEEGRGSASPLQTADFIEISVTDTGIGVKAEDLPKLFKEFTQLESVYTRRYAGTGLGLALSKKLVELHGGRIWVESEFGKGSKFTFVIPVKQEEKLI